MQIRASDWAAVRCRPLLCIDGFGGSEIERELRDDLTAEAEIGTSAEAINGRNGERIEHVVLVEIDAVCPVLCVKELCSQSQCYGRFGVECCELREVKRYVLRKAEAVTLHIIRVSGGSERPWTARPFKDSTSGVGTVAFLACSHSKHDVEC